MPNYCSYSMRVTGAPSNIREFIEVIQRDNNQEGRYFYRVFEAFPDEYHEETIPIGYVQIDGECAWSVHTCMMEGEGSYLKDEMKKLEEALKKIDDLIKSSLELNDKHFYLSKKKEAEENMRPSSLIRESRLLNLKIEVFSSEPGMGFEEHYLVENGKVIISECVDAKEVYAPDYDTVEELNEENETNFTKEEFESEEYLKAGGFDSWDFDNY